MKTKSIKDTIHGYIRIEEPFWKIIDTAEFQRLKCVEQTSYRVLYPSARHDRFIHSIGVYHLGQKAIDGLIKNSKEEDTKKLQEYRNSFLLGCILHDLGHAPFSHTCEDLYNYLDRIDNQKCELNSCLLNLYQSKTSSIECYSNFEKDYHFILKPRNDTCKAPSEHEIMSAILTIENFSKFSSFFDDTLDLDLAIRSILGCVYAVKPSDTDTVKQEFGLKNCLIRLLNSSTVDVDKLDYIARDTQMSGYDNVVLDNERLLDSTCYIVTRDGIYYPAFKKSALSVINNVILAKNSQAQWIVNHPTVLYDAYLLRRAIGLSIKSKYDKEFSQSSTILSFDELLKKIFSSESLSKKGAQVDNLSISLLSDVDLMYWMKQNIDNKIVSEYFSRDERKFPIWKSNEEFLFHLSADKSKAEEVSSFMMPLVKYLNKKSDPLYQSSLINNSLIDLINSEHDLELKDELIAIVNVLLSYTDAVGDKDFEYVSLPAKNNFFAKINAKNIFIRFGDDEHKYISYDCITESSTEPRAKSYEFFYLFSSKRIDVNHFLNYLYNQAHTLSSVRA